MTRAQRKSIERLKKKHRCRVLTLADPFLEGDVKVKALDPALPEDERVRRITPTGTILESD